MIISKINNIRLFNKNNNSNNNNYYRNLYSLKFDTVSFGAMKKSEFKGIDLLVVNKFQAPIEKFNSNEDFQNWCEEKTGVIKGKDYSARQNEATVQRNKILQEWFNYVQNENSAYKSAHELLILDGITKELSSKTDTLPPVLNKAILAQTMAEIQNNSKINPNMQVNFLKIYKTNLQKSILETTDDEGNSTYTGWVKIPSFKNDPENFDENVEKLKLLSHHSWCTKTFNAEPYLKEGDFHIYLEEGKPKIGVRFNEDTAEEIQGKSNNSEIPLKYFDIVQEHLKDEKIGMSVEAEFKRCLEVREKVEKIKKDFPSGIENASAEDIFTYFNIDVQKNKDGALVISEYRQPEYELTYEDLGIDEGKLLGSVKRITGNADFSDSKIEKLKNLEIIDGDAYFSHSDILNLGDLKLIKGNAYFMFSKVRHLGNLEHIKENANFLYSKVEDLGNLRKIEGSAKFTYSKLTSLKNLEYIGMWAEFSGSQITDLGNLKFVGEYAGFRNSQIKDLKNLRFIGEKAYVYDDQTELMEELKKRNLKMEIRKNISI